MIDITKLIKQELSGQEFCGANFHQNPDIDTISPEQKRNHIKNQTSFNP